MSKSSSQTVAKIRSDITATFNLTLNLYAYLEAEIPQLSSCSQTRDASTHHHNVFLLSDWWHGEGWLHDELAKVDEASAVQKADYAY